jgi:hypothetical protein
MSETIEQRTIEQIRETIKAAKDSVWVINDSIEKLTNGQEPSNELKNNIQSNVDHLKLVVADVEITASGEDISELTAGISAGEDKLSSTTWPTE